MAKSYNINTIRYLQGVNPTPAKFNTSKPSNEQPWQKGPTILTRPSGFKLSTRVFGGKRKKEQITQIYLHHTAGGQRSDRGEKTVSTFNKRKASTNTIIDASGHIEYVVPWDHRAYGQGVEGSKIYYNTIGTSTEIQALGYFKWRGDLNGTKNDKGEYWIRLGSVDENGKRSVTKIPLSEGASPVDFDLKDITYKTYKIFQKYTQPQVNSCIQWIKNEMQTYNIKWHFDKEAYKEMFPKKGTLSKKATSGVPGVYSHNSVKKDKSDIYPDKALIIALKKNFPKK